MDRPTLTQSYVNASNPTCPPRDDLVMSQLFDEAAKNGEVGEVLNLETIERITTTEIFKKADLYAKGMVALGLIPGEDAITVFACCGVEIISIFAAAVSVGVGYSHSYHFIPRDQTIVDVMKIMRSKVIVIGEGAGGKMLDALISLQNEDNQNAENKKLPTLEHVFYDNTYKNRNPSQKYLKPLDDLIKLGEQVTDEQLANAKKCVKPDHPMMYYFTSGSTGKPKAAVYTHYTLANFMFASRKISSGSTIGMNLNTDVLVANMYTIRFLCGCLTKMVMAHDFYEGADLEKCTREQVEAIINEKVKTLSLTGTFLNRVVDYIENEALETHIAAITYGGQHVSRSTKERHSKLFKSIPMTVYGMTEAVVIATTPLGPNATDLKYRMDGRLKLNAVIDEFRIVDEDQNIVAIGTEGEIQLKSCLLFKEYKNDPQKTKEAFTDDGFFKTGDEGVMFEDGSFIVHGRTPEAMRFKINRKVVYPAAIENLLSTHPDIREVVVVSSGISDCFGDEIAYCIRLKEGVKVIKEEELLAMTPENMWPARIIYMDSFPHTTNERKVNRLGLKDKVRTLIQQDESVGKTNYYKQLEERSKIVQPPK